MPEIQSSAGVANRERSGVPGKKIHATSEPLHTSVSLEHIARAADSLPAAGEPVWYPYRTGSRRAQATSILFFAPRHFID
jgi:hypothetical protein